MERNIMVPGYVYHIKEDYFSIANDGKLMRNYEGGAYRPTYFCLRDKKTDLFWVIPMSSRTDKYRPFVERDKIKFGTCLKIVIARYGDQDSAFLLQNMFPILPEYVDHIHTVKGRPVPVEERVKTELLKAFMEVRRLHSRGAKVVFPDIDRLERLMLAERDKAESNTYE